MLPLNITTTPKGGAQKSTPHPSSTWESDKDHQRRSLKSSQTLAAAESEIMPSFTGDKNGKIRVDDKAGIGGIGGWFAGTAAPVTVAIPGEAAAPPTEETSSTPDSSIQSRPSSKNTFKRTASSNMSFSSTSSDTTIRQTTTPSPSRFAFFSRSAPAPKVTQVSSTLDDEFLNLNITTALFPNGPADPFSPSSFKNLLISAEALLIKLQTAYKVRTLAVHELTREKEAQADELEEAETRAAHLKSQLEEMGKKLIQQDHDILAISNELAVEKQLRANEKAASEQQLLKIQTKSTENPQNRTSERSLISRGSRSSFESYNLEDTDSVFSHSRSHASTSSTGTGISTPETIALDSDDKSITSKASRNTSTLQKTNTNTKLGIPPLPTQQKSVFSKLLGGSNTSTPGSTNESGLGLSEMGCSNCRGGSSSVAWDAVGLLRAENKSLKDRVGLLEDTVHDALSLITRSWR